MNILKNLCKKFYLVVLTNNHYFFLSFGSLLDTAGVTQLTEQNGGDVFDWTHIQGPTPTFHTGPWKDHTLGTIYGHYLYIESSAPQEFKDTARGQDLSTSQHHCIFRFHYHMYGSHVFCLAVYLRTIATGRGQMLWVRYGDQGDLWHKKTLYLTSLRTFPPLWHWKQQLCLSS
uniref:MAM domain-containing protein n=1 Tax=Anabas testudineus TaxID=64144 RepID=A0A7N6F8F2_ANATE